MADGPGEYVPPTEVDISGPYHAWIDGEHFHSTLDIWGPKATLKIAMDGQDRPMVGMFVNNKMQVVAKYGAENFNLTTMALTEFNGVDFYGEYRRVDETVGAKVARIVLRPIWWDGGGGRKVKMPMPRQMSDVPGHYGLTLTKDGKTINTRARVKVDQGVLTMDAGGREYRCDFSQSELFPLYWKGNRMDTFKITATEDGFTGKLTKEIGDKTEEYEVGMVKGEGGSGGDDPDWTYVYDAIIANSPPIYIAKLTLHEDEARLAIDVRGEKATMTGSLVDGVLSGTGQRGRVTCSIRAEENANGFAGLFRTGSGASVRQFPIVLRNRPGLTAGPAW